ncbi:MAG: iron-siderophore ABC transporter substrate-binding protein [Thermomicrobiales bacterium]
MTGIIWNGTRRRLLGTTASLAAAAGIPAVIASPAGAQATPQAIPGSSIDLMPATPAALGAPEVPAATASTASTAVPEAVAFAPYADFGTDAAPGVFPRTIRHAFGETTIEKQPERVVVLDTGELDACVILGITPVGAAEYLTSGLPDYIASRQDDIQLVGTTAEPDLEAILALKPDLILSSKLRHDESVYAVLSDIAPTVFAERPGVTFKQNFTLYAETLGREVEARQVMDLYENGVRALNAELPSPRPTTSIVQIRPSAVRFYMRANFLGQILTDLGLPRNDAENVDDFAFDGSQENLGEYANDELVILAVQGGDSNEAAPEILGSPVWGSLPAVQADNVLEAPNDVFIGGIGYGSAMIVVNTIAEYFGLEPVIALPE